MGLLSGTSEQNTQESLYVGHKVQMSSNPTSGKILTKEQSLKEYFFALELKIHLEKNTFSWATPIGSQRSPINLPLYIYTGRTISFAGVKSGMTVVCR